MSFPGELISASCLFGEIQSDPNCTTMLSAAGLQEIFPNYGLELESCGIEYCDTDLCNTIREIPTQTVPTTESPGKEVPRTA